MNCCQHHLETYFRKRLKFIAIIQDIATNQNYFVQVSTNTGKKTISYRGATLWENVDQQFKDKSHNAFSNQYRSFLLLQYGRMSEISILLDTSSYVFNKNNITSSA